MLLVDGAKMNPKITKEWFKTRWTKSIEKSPWTEKTKVEIDFIVSLLKLNGYEKVLDIGCGYGRHSLELARRGFDVVGVDITESLIVDAKQRAKKLGLNAQFTCIDVLDLDYSDCFDVVLSIRDGAIGYFDNETDNLKIFDVVASALKKQGGKHFMEVLNASFIEKSFPLQLWEEGSQSLFLEKFDWSPIDRRVIHSSSRFGFGDRISSVDLNDKVSSLRVYSPSEINFILKERSMDIQDIYSFYSYDTKYVGERVSMLICSEKNS